LIKEKCLQERQLFEDPEFSSKVALGVGETLDTEPEKLCQNDSENQNKDKTAKTEDNETTPISVRRVHRCLPLSLRTQLTPLQTDAPSPRTPPPAYTPLPPKATNVPSSDPPSPTDSSPSSSSSSQPRPPLPRYQSTEGDIIEWRRARDLHSNPKFLPDDLSKLDCVVGRMTDCGVAASVFALLADNKLFSKVVPSDQSFEHGSYAGVFHFRFLHYGQLTDVVVDDFLPVVDGKVVYLHSNEEGVFWAPLLEKAYAKLTGCYSDLEMFPPVNTMVDLTQGVATNYDLLVEDCVPDDLFWKLKKKVKDPAKKSIACFSVWKKPSSDDTFEPHVCSFTLVDLVEVYVDGQEWPVRLVKMRNPHGVEREWKDSEEDWAKVSGDERERIGLDWLDDGEFYMPWKHVVTRMYKLSWINIEEEATSCQSSTCSGEWEKNKTAGGANTKRESYGANPQFKLLLTEVDNDAFMASCNISLMQRGSKEGEIAIGFSVYRCPMDVKGKLNIGRLRASYPVHVLSCEHGRDVSARIVVEPGFYIIVPYTFETNQVNEFTIKVVSEKRNELDVLEDENAGDVKFLEDPNDMKKPTRRHQGGRHPTCPGGHVLRLDGKKKRKTEVGGWYCDKCRKSGSKDMEVWRCYKRRVGTGDDGVCNHDVCGSCLETMLVEGVQDEHEVPDELDEEE